MVFFSSNFSPPHSLPSHRNRPWSSSHPTSRHRTRFRHTAIAHGLLLIQLLATAHQLVLRERDQLRSCHLLLHTLHRLSRGHGHLHLRRRRTLLHGLHANLNLHRHVFELRSRSCTKEVCCRATRASCKNRLEPK